MRSIKKKGVKLLCGMLTFGFITTSGSAFALTIDPAIFDVITQIIMERRQETIKEQYAAMPLKDQMRGKMMLERSEKNYLQDIIQPQMMQVNRKRIKSQMMREMVMK